MKTGHYNQIESETDVYRPDLQNAIRDWFYEQSFNFSLTLTCPMHDRGLLTEYRIINLMSIWYSLLSDLSQAIDFKFLRLGKRFYAKPVTERVSFIAFPEIGGGSLHFHLILKFPQDGPNRDMFVSNIEQTWLRICTSMQITIKDGTISAYLKEITPAEHAKAIEYCTKKLCTPNSYRNFILSSEFYN